MYNREIKIEKCRQGYMLKIGYSSSYHDVARYLGVPSGQFFNTLKNQYNGYQVQKNRRAWGDLRGYIFFETEKDVQKLIDDYITPLYVMKQITI
jgi:hypothetical protein